MVLKRFRLPARGIEGVIWSDGAATFRVNGGLPQSWTAAQVQARLHPADGAASEVALDDPEADPVESAPEQPCDAAPPCEHDIARHRFRPSGARDCTAPGCPCLVPPNGGN